MPFDMMSGYWSGIGAILDLLFSIFVIAGIVWLVLTLSRTQGRGADQRGSAISILDERLARGEIDVEEYRSRRAALETARR